MNTLGVERIAQERRRQIESEKWTARHDDKHDGHELVMAAVCYAACAAGKQLYILIKDDYGKTRYSFWDPWPWSAAWDKRSNTPSPAERLRMLEKAGAPIAAEIDRALRQRDREESGRS